jgi:hypothetical protein
MSSVVQPNAYTSKENRRPSPFSLFVYIYQPDRFPSLNLLVFHHILMGLKG